MIARTLISIVLIALASTGVRADEAWPTAADFELGQLRGGMRSDNGLVLNFAIDTQSLIDGVTTQTRSAAATLSIDAGGRLIVSQTAVRGALGTLIQNSTDHRALQAYTHVDAVVNSLTLLRTLELQRSLSRQLANTLR